MCLCVNVSVVVLFEISMRPQSLLLNSEDIRTEWDENIKYENEMK